ncbi:MAG: pentapeptide repeat-containing protein, partial [Candidatus Methylomirabilales bacterium]
MDEKVEGPQEQPSDRPALREVSPEELQKILEAHRKWVESEWKEGERAFLRGANLQKATLFKANLQQADLFKANLQMAGLWRASLQG